MADSEEVAILLVEDNAEDAELILRALQMKKVANQVHHVTDGAEALAFIFATGAYANRKVEQGPKVVLLDLKLPKVDGLEVLRRMKADARTRMTPVVILAASNEERDLLRSYELRANSYVVKPVESAKFAEAVTNLGRYWLTVNNVPR